MKFIDKETEKVILDLAKKNGKLEFELKELQGKYKIALSEIIKLQNNKSREKNEKT